MAILPLPVNPGKPDRLADVKESFTSCTLFMMFGIGTLPTPGEAIGGPVTEVELLGKKVGVIWFPVTVLLNPSCRSNWAVGAATVAPVALNKGTEALALTVDLKVTAYNVEVETGN